MTLEELQELIKVFDIQSKTPEQLSEAYKIARRKTEDYKTNSKEAKLLTKFSNDLLKQIRALRKKD